MKGSVLLVEDDSECAAGFVAVLEHEGYQVQTVREGATALMLLRAGFCPDVILLDLMLPGMDGLAFRREQIADPLLRDIPVIAVSGVDRLLDRIRTDDVAAIFRKPVVFLRLLRALEAQIAR